MIRSEGGTDVPARERLWRRRALVLSAAETDANGFLAAVTCFLAY